MKTYSVLYAEDVPHYGQAEIEATDADAAIDAARKLHRDGPLDLYDADFNNTVCKRIVHIEDADGNIVAEDLPADNYVLHSADADKRLKLDAAEEMFEALCAQEMAEYDPEASRRNGCFDNARELRNAALAQARGQKMSDIDNHSGMKCPECGSSDEILTSIVWVRRCHDGTGVTAAANGDQEWDDTSSSFCSTCGHRGDVAAFLKAGGGS